MIRNERKAYIKTLEKMNKENQSHFDDFETIKELKRNKFDEKKEVVTRFKEINGRKASFDNEINSYKKQMSKYRKYMKDDFTNKAEIERQLK